MGRVAFVLLIGVVGLACANSAAVWRMGIRGMSTEFTVEQVSARAGYLDVQLSGKAPLRTFIPDDGSCRAIVKPGARVRYVWDGAMGSVAELVGSRSCQAVGVGSLPEWRQLRPQDVDAPENAKLPREIARYRVVFRDRDVILARGYFPLSRHLGWVGRADAIAVMRNTPSCQRGPAAANAASLEYFPAGDRVLGLVLKNRWCDVEALLLPLAQAR
ncbi:MAG: hypothetical protein ABFS41_00900 [Myxococcota bacterium]